MYVYKIPTPALLLCVGCNSASAKLGMHVPNLGMLSPRASHLSGLRDYSKDEPHQRLGTQSKQFDVV